MEIRKNLRNELLKRQEVAAIVEFDKNPGFSEMRKKLSEELSRPEDCIDVYNVNGKFGRKTFLVKAYVYDSPELLVQMIELSKTKKQKEAEKKAKEEAEKAAAEAKKANEENKDKGEESSEAS